MNKEISLTDYQEVVKKATKVILTVQEHFLRQSNQTSIIPAIPADALIPDGSCRCGTPPCSFLRALGCPAAGGRRPGRGSGHQRELLARGGTYVHHFQQMLTLRHYEFYANI